MKLTNTKIKNTQPKDKPYKLSDGKGLYLLINPNGTKYWRMAYRFNGKQKLLANKHLTNDLAPYEPKFIAQQPCHF